MKPIALLALLAPLAGFTHAAVPDGRLFEPDRAWLERYDGTLLSSRYLSEVIYESYDNDSCVLKNENTLRWGIPWRDDHAFGIQAMLPVKWRDIPGDEEFGLGDIELRTGILGRISPTTRYGLALNAVIDSATDPILSDNAFVLRPIAALRWDYNANVTFGINVEYNVTPLDENASDVSALEVKLPVAFRINEDWSGFLSYNPRWDLLAENDRHRLELGTTFVFGADNEYAWSLSTEVPLDSEAFQFKVATGFAWYF